ncbi:hypothetical protein [Micromonospora sp. CPCC 206061]|uniref:hypothetical protein n=1 Tax=Micromonospora sp. CPCC 206061 TaxID=3122410 RepID=UPI002FEFF0E1
MSNWSPDSRSLFTRVVDDILAQIREGRLQSDQRLPSGREMADRDGVSIMPMTGLPLGTGSACRPWS